MSLIESNKFDIRSLENIIEQFERSLERIKAKPKTKKRTRHIKELESLIESRKDKIRALEIEIEEMKGDKGRSE